MALIKNKMIQSVHASKIEEAVDRRFTSDAEKAVWNAKASTDVASALANGLMSKEHYAKLEAIEAGANKYVHPDSHAATMIDQDSTHRMVTDTQISAWDAKAETTIASAIANGLMSKEHFSKLEGIETGANNYSHPLSHSIDMIETTSEKQTVSQAEKDAWNGKQAALGFTPENVAMKGVANGYAGLDANGKVPLSQLPDPALEQTHIVSTMAARDALIPTLKTADRVVVLNAGDGSREGYLFDKSLNEGVGGFYQDSDTDWANINLSWANIVDGPTASVSDINYVVSLKTQIDTDHTKLGTIQANAEVNQNAFSRMGNGTVTFDATSKTDAMSLVGGTNIEVTVDAGTKKLTFNVTGKVASAAAADLATAATKLETARKIKLEGDVTGEVMFDGQGDAVITTTVVELNSHHHDIAEVDGLQGALDAKAGLETATTLKNGLMSTADKTKLDAAKNRYTKRIVLPAQNNNAVQIATGIKMDGTGAHFTDVNEIGVYINGMLLAPGTTKDYTTSVNGSNEIVIEYKQRNFPVEDTDEIVVEFNQLG